jgi:hypothetical protein
MPKEENIHELKLSSIGLKSGEYGGKNLSIQPINIL